MVENKSARRSRIPDLDYVTSHLRYDPSGHLYWKTKNGTTRRTDIPAGGRHGDSGYRQISIQGKLHFAHRVIWFIHHGPIPPGIFVDHVNSELDADGWKDDRIENLRLATPLENVRNRGGSPKNSTIGIRGSYWCKRLKRFITRINVNGKSITIESLTARGRRRPPSTLRPPHITALLQGKRLVFQKDSGTRKQANYWRHRFGLFMAENHLHLLGASLGRSQESSVKGQFIMRRGDVTP